MPKLEKGEIQGIRLIADLYVFNDLVENVFEKDERLKDHSKELKDHVKKACPKFELAQKELQHQLEEVRSEWVNLLKNK